MRPRPNIKRRREKSPGCGPRLETLEEYLARGGEVEKCPPDRREGWWDVPQVGYLGLPVPRGRRMLMPQSHSGAMTCVPCGAPEMKGEVA